MCLQIKAVSAVPELTERIAQAAFPKGNFCLKMRQEMGTLFTDEDFAELYSKRGQPALAPWRLALVTVMQFVVMQFVEDLSDRQAAEAVRARIDWKYALGLELTDPGFDYSVLCEFRKRLVKGGKDRLLLDRLLSVFREKKLLKTHGRQRTDSTHVLAAIRVMNRLELVETLRATLNALAAVDPLWLHSVAPDDWYSRYRQRAEQSQLPRGEKARKEYAEQVGNDGLLLMQLLDAKDAKKETENNTEKEAKPETPLQPKSLPPSLNTLAAVETLRQMWERDYVLSEAGILTWRKEADLTRAAMSIESPYDTQARHSTKRDIRWTGYKVHLTETCDPDLPRIVTHVQTTVATTQDISCTATIQQALAEADLLPSRHLVDTGYVDAAVLVSSLELHNVELFGPPRDGQSWQAREGGYDQSRFSIDWSKQEVTCPEGKVSAGWGSFRIKPYDREIVKVRFADRDCAAYASRSQCVRSPRGQSRSLVLPPQAHYEALQQMRGQIDSEEGAKEYKKRAGIEGSLSQGIRRSDLRHARYRGLSKTHLQHLATAAALNLLRVVIHLQGMPLARTQVSRFAQRAA